MKRLFLIQLMIVVVAGLVLGACAQPAPAPTPAPALAPAPATTPAPASAPEKPIELKFSHPWPPGPLPTKLGDWVKKIEELAGGRVKITIYGSGSLGNMPEQYNLALTRTADIISTTTGSMPGVFPRAEVISLPMLWKFNEAATAVYWDLMQKYMKDTEFKDTKVILVYTSGLQNAFTRAKPVQTLEDFKGLKFGAQGPMLTEIVKAFGAVPVFLQPADMYTALERGMIEGWFFDWDGATAFKLPEVTKYRTGNVGVSTDPMVQVMNLETWNSLPPDIQKIFDETGPEWSRQIGADWDEWGLIAIQHFADYDKQVGNPPIYYLPESEKARWKEAVQPVIDKWVADEEAKGRLGRAMVEDLHALQEKYTK